ncbi:hypothetical protein KSP39_PZI000283 [Platanthera zijinensis]|uniref:Uncharacterized protein n=1 Tax=Platanthera zijinensis TaxID=2320716 RepID=A0AAP0C228_9ASPA
MISGRKMLSLVVIIEDNIWMPSSGELSFHFSQFDTLSRDDDHTIKHNNTQAVASDDIGSATPDQSSQSGVASKKCKGKKLNMRVKQIMLLNVEKLCYSSDVIMQCIVALVPPSMYLLREAIQKLEKYPEIFENRQLYHFATIHFQSLMNRVTFLSISEDKIVEWLMTNYMVSFN